MGEKTVCVAADNKHSGLSEREEENNSGTWFSLLVAVSHQHRAHANCFKFSIFSNIDEGKYRVCAAEAAQAAQTRATRVHLIKQHNVVSI